MTSNKKNNQGGFSFARLSINRPIFITCIVLMTMVTGWISMKTLPVDLFPDVTFPVVTVTTPYPGAGPRETEMLISKIFEEEFATISGVKTIRSVNQEGVSIVITEFNFNVDIKYAEQQVRDKVSSARAELPDDIEEPVIRRVDPSDQPIVTIALTANLSEAELYDLANLTVKPKFEQINQVGLVEIIGGREREVRVDLDLDKLKFRQVSAIQVVDALGKAGANIPSGKIDVSAKKETVFRTLGEFQTLDEMKNTIVQFLGNDVPVVLSDVASVREGLEDQKNLAYVNGERSLFISVYRQTGANTVEVAENVVKQTAALNEMLSKTAAKSKLTVVRDGSKAIRDNLFDVQESITIGIILTVIVVFFFLASFRSTVITSLALPNSLLGAFILLAVAGYTVNVMSLLALSLAVGLLIDDAIVVRENIFRHMEMGKPARRAAIEGTEEVMLAVIATTLTVIAVFGPIAFISGVVGQFLKQFGMTVCFALMISLFDAITIAPMMSAYFAGKVVPHGHAQLGNSFYDRTVGRLLAWFNKFQDKLEDFYVEVLKVTLKHPLKMIMGGILIFFFSIYSLKWVPKTFLAAQDNGEFSVNLDLPPGTSLSEMERVALDVDKVIRGHKEIDVSVLTVGTKDGEANKANFYVRMVPAKKRTINTIKMKQMLTKELTPFAYANVRVSDFDQVGAGQRPFNVNITGNDEKELERISRLVFEKIKDHPALTGVDLSYRPGKPEFQVLPDRAKAERLGVSTNVIGMELRTLMEGQTPAVYRLQGEEYDIRVRLAEDQRNLQRNFEKISVPNINGRLIPLKNVSKGVETTGPANITRQDRARYYQISADIAANGPGMGAAMADMKKILEEIKLPEGMGYRFVGQAETFGEMITSMAIASGLGILFIYLVLASLYESFITPFTIMLVLPLAICGAFFALALTGASLDLFSMIGCIMLLGVATKNSIILVDYTSQQINDHGKTLKDAILLAGKNRLRPILMTSFALIAGFVPIAVGLNEASAQRTSMGIALIGGLISSTLLTLIIVPAAYTYIERLRLFVNRVFKKMTGADIETESTALETEEEA